VSQISYTGSFNSGTLIVPDFYLNIQAPQSGVIPPAPFGRVGVVGIAGWGPVNKATLISGTGISMFGNLTNRTYDLVTAATIVLQSQGAAGLGANMTVVRVTDGTDTAATASVGGTSFTKETATIGGTITNGDAVRITATSSGITGSPVTVSYAVGASDTVSTIAAGLKALINANSAFQAVNLTATVVGAVVTIVYPTSLTVTWSQAVTGSATETVTLAAGTATVYGATFTSYYTGSYGNQTAVTIGTGSAIGTFKVTITVPNIGSETYNNITGSGTTFWTNLCNAINNGQSAIRGPSQLISATLGQSNVAPTPATTTLSGGTDGVLTLSSSTFIGVDVVPRTGMYALRNSQCSDAFIADMSDTTQESAQLLFGQSEGILMHAAGPPGETPATAQTTRSSVGTDNQWFKRYLGDWCYWQDNTNNVRRLLAPQVFGVATMCTLQPQQSALNQQTPAVLATQRSLTGSAYANDELATLTLSDIEVICNPIPAGASFGCRIGLVCSSNDAANTDNWPRLTSFIARSLTGPGALGTLIGQPITPQFFTNGYGMLQAFFAQLAGTTPATISGYNILFGTANNPQSQTSRGIVTAQVWVQYLGIARIFVVNMQTGATVVLPANNDAPPASLLQLAA
jgi:hypothetical protein